MRPGKRIRDPQLVEPFLLLVELDLPASLLLLQGPHPLLVLHLLQQVSLVAQVGL